MITDSGPLPGTPEPDNPEQGYLPREVEMLRFADTGETINLDRGPFVLPAMEAWGRNEPFEQ